MPKIQQQHAVFLIILAAAALRMLPHPENVTPIGALALFSGAYLQRQVLWLVPLAALFLGDLSYGLYNGVVMVMVYLGFIASTAIGRGLLHSRDNASRICLGVGAGALAFWLISNLGNWLAFGPHSMQGLFTCYVRGLPYLANSLMGDAAYAVLLFGGYRLLCNSPFVARPATA